VGEGCHGSTHCRSRRRREPAGKPSRLRCAATRRALIADWQEDHVRDRGGDSSATTGHRRPQQWRSHRSSGAQLRKPRSRTSRWGADALLARRAYRLDRDLCGGLELEIRTDLPLRRTMRCWYPRSSPSDTRTSSGMNGDVARFGVIGFSRNHSSAPAYDLVSEEPSGSAPRATPLGGVGTERLPSN
jgi:hypothetical protein